MHATILPLIAALLAFTPRTLALPTTQATNPLATLLPRTNFCYNAPNTKAGTPLPPPSPPTTPPLTRTPTITWCAPGSSTYLHITYAYAIKTPYIETLLLDASAFISLHISAAGDGPLPGGVYELRNYGLKLRFTNANNHQQTWGVTGAAVVALREYMQMYILAERKGVSGRWRWRCLMGELGGEGALQMA
ncbi:MAG: hypothetical protein FRX48_09114 [Lasallia pustulata]|uniref:Uncharacterized protein n=1 Tax=Lasallia pustulata TaxID=136370 RepID=A0A5M8PDP4_9LECA|nr:MAG: hypothetical protein FRX48_09114 [Lasallia pustulata]